jgi:pilus assembly protein Flp/PilA
MNDFFVRLIRREAGVTAIEYGLIAALVSIACIGAMNALGGSLQTAYLLIAAALAAAACVAAAKVHAWANLP